MVRKKSVRRHVSFDELVLPAVAHTDTGGLSGLRSFLGTVQNRALGFCGEAWEWWTDHAWPKVKVVVAFLAVTIGASLATCGLLWLLMHRPWIFGLLCFAALMLACTKNEKLATVVAVAFFGILGLAVVCFFGLAITMAAPFVFLAEAPILATATVVAAVLALIFFGGGG